MIFVILSPEAIQNPEELAAYAGQFSTRARLNLLAAVAAKMQLLEQQPEMYPVAADRAPFRRCVVHPLSAYTIKYRRMQLGFSPF